MLTLSWRLVGAASKQRRCLSYSAINQRDDKVLTSQVEFDSTTNVTAIPDKSGSELKLRVRKSPSTPRIQPGSSVKVPQLTKLSNNNKIEITRASSGGKTLLLDSLWLRDHCQCSKCVNQDTMQKTFDTFSLPTKDTGEIIGNDEVLRVRWHDGHISEYQWNWIDHNTGVKPLPKMFVKKVLWGSEIADNPPSVHYDEIMAGNAGVGQWTKKIFKFGFCFVDGCPVSPEKTEELLRRIAHIRVTHYGGFYDFTSDLSMKDTAYTSQALPAHTDNAYFTEPSGLQMFHLLSHTEGAGGASLLVDGLNCRRILEEQDSKAVKTLINSRIRWHASGNEDIVITSAEKFPVLSGFPHGQIRWNNDDRATIKLKHENDDDGILSWYDAARKFDDIVKSQQNEYWEQLKPGRPLIFDNWRILHGRSAFSGKRRLCGGYISRDDYMSRYLTTNFSREQVLMSSL